MASGLFITGGGGFVGRRLLLELSRTGRRIVALDRSGAVRRAGVSGVDVVEGDLLDPATYRDSLATCDAVLHLAASTGNASREDHQRVNARGTEVLVDEARRAGVARFLFVSSIAVTFPDRRGYHYAEAKAQAEAIVRASGLPFLIVRPAMILGAGAPILGSLEKLALLPIAVLPGAGLAKVQPIHVDDVVSCLVSVVERDAFTNETVAVGGPETLSMEQLLRRLRVTRTGRTGPLIRVPLPLLQLPLSLAEAAGLGRLLPLTAGQLSSFRSDGVASPNALQRECEPVRGLRQMLERAEPQAGARTVLDAECEVFTRHLIGATPDAYVRSKYLAAHNVLPVLVEASPFDRFLVNFARRGRVFTRLADAHAAVFAPASLLRKKLVLLLAILETCPPTHRVIDAPVGGRPLAAVLSVGLSVIAAVACLVAGSLVLFPVRVLLTATSRNHR